MTKLWQKFADFLHTANLIPLVVLVSSYHYFQALRSHDPVLVAVPMALFVDLLHFRTVEQAVKSHTGLWQATAVFTTLLAFGLQYIFYSQPGEGEHLALWQVILFASIVPVGLAIMAWHHQQQEQAQVTDWQRLLIEAQKRAERTQQEAADAQERAGQMQREAAAERQRADEMQARAEEVQVGAASMQNQLAQAQQEAAIAQEGLAQMQREAETEREQAVMVQTQLERVQAQANKMQRQLAQVQAEAAQLQIALDEKQVVSRAWQTLNLEMQTLALFNAQMLSAQDAAEKLEIHVSTVRRKAKQINGVGGQN